MWKSLQMFLFICFFLLGMQIPNTVSIYKTGLDAVILEIKSDRGRLQKIAYENSFTIQELFVEATKDSSALTKDIIEIMEDKIPRLNNLLAQQEAIKSGDLLRIMRVVFFENGDSLIRQNTWNNFSISFNLGVDIRWLFWITMFSFVISSLLTLVFNLIFSIKIIREIFLPLIVIGSLVGSFLYFYT